MTVRFISAEFGCEERSGVTHLLVHDGVLWLIFIPTRDVQSSSYITKDLVTNPEHVQSPKTNRL
jgi:hypothetical protein